MEVACYLPDHPHFESVGCGKWLKLVACKVVWEGHYGKHLKFKSLYLKEMVVFWVDECGKHLKFVTAMTPAARGRLPEEPECRL